MTLPDETMKHFLLILFILAIFALGFYIGWWIQTNVLNQCHAQKDVIVQEKLVYLNQTCNASGGVDVTVVTELPTLEPTPEPTPEPEPTYEPDPAPDPTPVPHPTTLPVSEFPFRKELLK